MYVELLKRDGAVHVGIGGDVPFFNFKGFDIYYRDQGGGAPLIFLHNAGNDHRLWSFQIDYFSRTHRVLALDLVGYGRSDRPAINYTLSLYTEMVTAFVNYLELDHFILIGHCIGGAISLNLTLTIPHQIDRLVLSAIATLNTMIEGAYGILYHLNQNLLARLVFERIIAPLRPPRWMNRISMNQQYGSPYHEDPAFLAHLHQLYRHPDQIRVLYNLLLNFAGFGVLDSLSKSEPFPPVLVIWGKDNRILRFKGGERFCQRFKPDQFTAIDGCGHMVMREAAEAVNQLIEEFIG